MSEPTDILRRGPGYTEFQEASARTPLKDYPWKTIAGNVLGIGAAHAAGYIAAGLLVNALSKSSVGGRFAQLNPETQRRILTHTIGAAGAAGTVASSMASLGGQIRLANEIHRREQERLARGAPVTKVASLMETYALLESLR